MAATTTLMGCSDGGNAPGADLSLLDGKASELPAATPPLVVDRELASGMPAALRIAAIRATQESAPAHYDFERGAYGAVGRLRGNNQAQRLGVDVDGQGVRITDSGAGETRSRWQLGLRLGRICRADACSRLDATSATLEVSRNRAVIDHVDGVEEWYVNGPLGVEQGFTLAHRPTTAARADADPLVLEVELSGDLAAEMRADGGWVSLVDESGRAIARYTDLFARDAAGRLLDARMAAGADSISIHVSDHGASYPIEIDPLVWVETGGFDAGSPEDGAFFGSAVAMVDDLAIVGAPYEDAAGTDRGAAYVFERDYPQAGQWGIRKRLVPSAASDGDNFGAAVALSESLAVVGSPGADFAGTGSGIAYVFDRNDSGTPDSWGQTAQLVPSDGQAGDSFGWSVAIAGDAVVVGARGEDGTGSSRGAVYVFDRHYPTTNAWDQRTKLTAGDPNDLDLFGAAVAIVHDSDANDDLVLVGAPGDDAAASNAGAAYVFSRNTPTANGWAQQRKIMPGAVADADFGIALSATGDLLLVGAQGESNDTGAAYLFERDLGGQDQWGQRMRLVPASPEADSSFGIAVAVSDEYALVGASNSGHYAGGGGMVFAFQRDLPTADAWGEQNGQGASDPEVEAHYGSAVALSGSVGLVGAPGHDGAAGTNRGRVYLLEQRLMTGDACTDAAECITGYCVDGVCCESACEGGADDCQACSVAAGGDGDGACSPLENGSTCSDGVYCNGTETCTGGACGNATGDPCEGPDDDEDCAESCDEEAASCSASDPDGSSCADGLRACEAGICIGSAGSECTNGTECETGYCTDGVCCTESDCSPYRCGPAGDCGSTCTMNAECATGFRCDGAGRCVADGTPVGPGVAEEEGGCSCRVGSERRERDEVVSLLGLVALLGLRRRRRA